MKPWTFIPWGPSTHDALNALDRLIQDEKSLLNYLSDIIIRHIVLDTNSWKQYLEDKFIMRKVKEKRDALIWKLKVERSKSRASETAMDILDPAQLLRPENEKAFIDTKIAFLEKLR